MDISRIVERVLDGDDFSIYTTIKVDEKFKQTLKDIPEYIIESLLKTHIFEINVNVDKIENEVYGYVMIFNNKFKIHEFACSYDEIQDYPDTFVEMLIRAESVAFETLNKSFIDYSNSSPLKAWLKPSSEICIYDMVDEHIIVKTHAHYEENEVDKEEALPRPLDNKNYLLHNANHKDENSCKIINDMAKYIYELIVSTLTSGFLYGIKLTFTTKNPLDEDMIVTTMFESYLAFGGSLVGGYCSWYDDFRSILDPHMEYINVDNYEKCIHDMVEYSIFETLTFLNKMSSGDIHVNIISVADYKEEIKYVC